MTLTTIYTENTPDYKANVKSICNRYFPEGYTLIEGLGVWRGQEENSLIIQVAGTLPETVFQLVIAEIKLVNSQIACLMVQAPANVKLI